MRKQHGKQKRICKRDTPSYLNLSVCTLATSLSHFSRHLPSFPCQSLSSLPQTTTFNSCFHPFSSVSVPLAITIPYRRFLGFKVSFEFFLQFSQFSLILSPSLILGRKFVVGSWVLVPRLPFDDLMSLELDFRVGFANP